MKKNKFKEKTSKIVKGKMNIKGKEVEMDIAVETEPNEVGGYNTRIKLPVSPMGATKQ